MKNPQIWVKQLFTNLHQYGHKHIPKEVIEDINQSVIQEKVKKPMAEELIFGALSKGGHVDITIEKNEIFLKYSSNQDKKKELV